jgi:outer membrane protein assembly factor BamB
MKFQLTAVVVSSALLLTPVMASVRMYPQEKSASPAKQTVVDWPQFRGIAASGVADGRALPGEWDVAKNKGVRWRTAIPGLSHSSPIVSGNRVFVTTAVAKGGDASLKVGLYGAGESAKDMVEHTFQLWCLDLAEGRPLWVRTATRVVPKFARHTKATHVDSTPVTDGKNVIAMFGSQGMFCYSTDGDLRWKVDLGELDVGPHNDRDLHWGYASSPVIGYGKVIVQADVKKDPYLGAWDVATGKPAWRVARDDTTSWATPTVIGDKADAQVLVNGCKHMGAYTLADGKEIWRMAGGGGLPIPAPLLAGDLLLFTSNHRPLVAGHPLKPIFAVKRSATGTLPVPRKDEPGKQLAWMKVRVGNYIQTPIVYRGLIYLCNMVGVVTILNAKTGELYGRNRLGEGGVGFSASPVAGDGKLYFTNEEGEVYVVKAGKEFVKMSPRFSSSGVVKVNPLGEICMATPAIADGVLLFRTRGHVVAVGPAAK